VLISLSHVTGPKPTPLATRFTRHFRKDPTGCWVWIGAVNNKGYGVIGTGPHTTITAHRAAWILTHGAIPHGLCVLHRCDTRHCVRPDHLFLGTIRDNNHDMMRKGRDRFRGRPSITSLTPGSVPPNPAEIL
jgi:HNH endonuclease